MGGVVAPERKGEAIVDGRPGRDQQVAELFDRHYQSLRRLASFLLDDPAGAEEVVQEAFLRTYSGWWRIRRPERAGAYLRAAVVNQCRSRGRRRKSEDRGNRVLWTDEDRRAESPTSTSADALDVVAAVRALPPRQREAVVLRYYEDLSEADIARALGCSTGTVKSQLAKARATLSARLGDEQGDER
jgi:RNA polymerase sigma-70 factor (sigma-E family)